MEKLICNLQQYHSMKRTVVNRLPKDPRRRRANKFAVFPRESSYDKGRELRESRGSTQISMGGEGALSAEGESSFQIGEKKERGGL